MEPIFIDTTAALADFLGGLGETLGQPPRLYMDLEGNDLSRAGTLSLVTILLEPEKDVYLIDVTTLGQKAFTTADNSGRTFKSVMESPDIIKVFFDIRNDSDALYSLYGIRVAGIEDLQLMELASRNFSKKCVNGLAKCIDGDHTIGYAEKRQWQTVKDQGRKSFDPARGGSYSVFDQRPLSEVMKRYCAQDVTFMPHLRQAYRQKLCDAWWRKIETETVTRIQLSQTPRYNGKGRHMALAPTSWMHFVPSSSERQLRTLLQDMPDRNAVEKSRPSSPSPVQMPIGKRDFDDAAAVARGPDESVELAQRVAVTRRSSPDVDSDGDFAGRYGGGSFGGDSPDYGSSGGDDFTACDKDDCGYCGRCAY
ncbi:hypothetical protein TI39_contig47g00017 [Zymoseptoria brevis]|uniref:3'-5' exonuclease domain-containing protein n=1 Tax=Zymoseptoria brevis TaxID=1047168 RepID=A0A0F4H1X6_9PEZI|nr:hypothetical protein TI39_contig47g00017 [Zymoseptoria brevis]